MLDCSNEKLFWLDALAPWVATSFLRDSSDQRSSSGTRGSSFSSSRGAVRSGSGGAVRGDTMIASYSGSGNISNAFSNNNSNNNVEVRGRIVQKLVSSSLGNAAAAMMGAITIGGLEELTETSALGIAGVAANAKKLQTATSDMMRAFAVRNSLPSNFSTAITNSNSSYKTAAASVPVVHVEPLIDFSDFEDRPSETVKGGYSVPYSSSLQTNSTQSNFLSIVSPDFRENHNASKQTNTDTGTDTAAALDANDVLDLLDAVSSPLSHAQTLLEGALALSQKLQEHTTVCLRSGLKWVAQAIIGVRSLHVAAEEVGATSRN